MQVSRRIVISVEHKWRVLYFQIGIGKETAKASPRQCLQVRDLTCDIVKHHTGIARTQCQSIHRRSQ